MKNVEQFRSEHVLHYLKSINTMGRDFLKLNTTAKKQIKNITLHIIFSPTYVCRLMTTVHFLTSAFRWSSVRMLDELFKFWNSGVSETFIAFYTS